MPLEDPKQGKERGTLVTRLAPPPQPSPPPSAAPPVPPVRKPVPPAPKPQPPSQAHRSPPPVQAAPRPPDPPRVLAPESPVSIPTPPAHSATPPAAPRAPADDFAANVAARRRAREAAANAAPSAPSNPSDRIETEKERHSREVAANLGLNATPTFGGERSPGGGMFQLQNVTSDEAQLVFYGFNKEIQRNARQVLTVRRGSNPSIQFALVRRMIAIIREHESGDFIWESPRLGRNVTLSARMADNAGLEDFLMREFFPEYASRR